MTKDITGRKHGMLTAVRFSHRVYKGYSYWFFKCDCGNEILCPMSLVQSGAKKSCGCSTRNGMSKTKLKGVFSAMYDRCYRENCREFKRYGARGIKICNYWYKKSYNFYTWALSNGYEEGLQIDRIDNNGNYSPENCRWVTRKVNANNKRNTVYITHEGITLSAYEWSKRTGISAEKIKTRFRSGFNTNAIFSKDISSMVRKRIPVIAINKFNGEKLWFESKAEAMRQLNLKVIRSAKTNRKRKGEYNFEFLPEIKPKDYKLNKNA